MPQVFELTGNYNHIESGNAANPLIFPNVLTCMAFVASYGAEIIGVHFTIGDATTPRVNGAWQRVLAKFVMPLGVGPIDVYCAGPGWNANLLANMAPHPATMRGGRTPAGVNIRATLGVGGVTLEWQHVAAAAAGLWNAVNMF